MDDTDPQFLLDAVCSRFDSRWINASDPPQMEPFLDEVGAGQRDELFELLLAIDLEHRRARSLACDTQFYCELFPQYVKVINAQLSPAATRTLDEPTRRQSASSKSYRCPDCDHVIAPPEGDDSTDLICQSCGNKLTKATAEETMSLTDKRATPAGLDETVLSGANDDAASGSQPQSEKGMRYRVTKLHAQGGLGAVFRARDLELDRTVALKEILPAHSGNLSSRERFAFEAQVTGSLEHPGIVPVYGFGRYQDQRPYYAMRFIRGESFRNYIRRFHREHPVATPSDFLGREFRMLLQRLVDVCNALHYAHEHGVLHRDIKPSNIMLGEYGETLVVDWGLAKIVDLEGPAAELGDLTRIASSDSGSRTSQGDTVGTPLYMSPEQARGEHDSLDARADVYSLGAVLFNIISGQVPVEGSGGREIVAKVRDGKLRKISSVAPAAPKPLASICRKALALQASDRYASAHEMAADIERWLSDEVVEAHREHETALEKVGRLSRRYRNWTVSLAASLLLITAISITAALLIQSAKQETERSKQEAVARYRDARGAIDTWLVQSSDALEFFPETQVVREQLLQFAVDEYKQLGETPGEDPELQIEQGRVLVRLGQLSRQQREFEQARQYFREALEVFQSLEANSRFHQTSRAELGNLYTNQALSRSEQDDLVGAQSLFEKSIEQLRSVVDQNDDPLAQHYLAAANVNFGALLERRQEYDAATIRLAEGIRQYASLGTGAGAEIELGIARARERRGKILARLARHDEAAEEFDQAIDRLQTLVAEQPDQPQYLEALAVAENARAFGFRDRGFEREFIDAVSESVGHFRDLCQSRPEVPGYLESLSMTLTNLGLALHESGMNQQALITLDEAEGLLLDLVDRFPHIARCRESLAACQDAVGQVQVDFAQDPTLAIESLAAAVRSCQTLTEQDPNRSVYFERLAVAASHYAQALTRDGEQELARRYFAEAIEILEQLAAERETESTQGIAASAYLNPLAEVHYYFALTLDDQQDPEAKAEFEAARDLWLQIGQYQTARDKHQLAWLMATCPVESIIDLPLAVGYAQDACELAPRNPRFMNTLALCQFLSGDIDEAQTLLSKIRSLRGFWIDRDHFVMAMVHQQSSEADLARQSMQLGEAWKVEHQPFNARSGLLAKLAGSWLENNTN